MTKTKEEKKKPTPKLCICGRGGITVHKRGAGVMMSCPDPVNCAVGPMTRWCGSEEAAVEEWNRVVDGCRRKR